MSGGTMDYLYCKIDDASFKLYSPERKAFKALLDKVSVACQKIEWNDSGDGADGENEAIRACLGDSADALILKEAVIEAEDALVKLAKALDTAKAGLNG